MRIVLTVLAAAGNFSVTPLAVIVAFGAEGAAAGLPPISHVFWMPSPSRSVVRLVTGWTGAMTGGTTAGAGAGAASGATTVHVAVKPPSPSAGYTANVCAPSATPVSVAPVVVQGTSALSSSTQNGASPASLPSMAQLSVAVRSVVEAGGVARKRTVCTGAVAADTVALNGLVGWYMSSRASFQTLNRRVAWTWNW